MKRLAIHDPWRQSRPTTYDALKKQRGGPAAEDMIGIGLHKRASQLFRDARALAEACRLGAYRAIHRASATQRHVRVGSARTSALEELLNCNTDILRDLAQQRGSNVAPSVHRHGRSPSIGMTKLLV